MAGLAEELTEADDEERILRAKKLRPGDVRKARAKRKRHGRAG